MLAHQRLRGLLVDALLAGPAVCAYVRRGVTKPLPADEPQGVFVRVLGGPGEALLLSGEAPIDWHAMCTVECVSRATTGATADEAVGPLLAAVYARLMADVTVAAAGFQILPSFDLRLDEADVDDRIGAATLHFQVRWRGSFASMEA